MKLKSRGRRLLLLAALATGGLTWTGSSANAGPLDKLAKQLVGIDAEVSDLGRGLRRPDNIGKVETADLVNRRLIDAQVNFGVGNYDDAAVMLYDFVEKHPTHRSWDEALYLLAESLFQKGDYVASRSYFIRLVDERGTQSKFYQQSLERLIELTLKLDDSKDVNRWLSALDQVPQQDLRDSVPYVRGKYSYFLDNFDESIKHFEQVKSSSKYFAQAQYFLGVNYVAKNGLGKAIDAYKKLVTRKATTNEERRVAELSHMALGRLYYERDQPSKAVDEYLRISRRSDLFDDALFEVTWVYVKNKEFNKALQALELLALADPTSERMPDVRILEGNLRIRKAQRIAIEGKGNSKEQYDKATEVFDFTRKNFRESYDRLKEIVASDEDASAFLAQITGRNSETFDVSSTLPEVAAAWLRQQPEVARVVNIETDLGQIDDEIKSAEKTIARLEAAINTASKVNIFPSLAQKRYRSIELLEDIFKIQTQLATHAGAIADKYVSGSEKNQLQSDQSESTRIGLARARYTELEERAAEVSTIIDVTEAQLVALEKYVTDSGESLKPEDITKIDEEMKASREEVNKMRQELALIRRDSTLAKDRAGTGDEVSTQRTELQKQLRAALTDELNYMKRLSSKMSGSDQNKMQQIARMSEQSRAATNKLDNVNSTIDAIVDDALVEVRTALSEEKAQLGAYRREFVTYEAESHGLGGEVLALSFQSVSNKFYDILVRSDVGIVDVAWSLKEAAETTLKRLNLNQARERRTLDSNFADVIREIREDEAQKLFDQAAGK
jgi:hypothetical protein